MGWIDIVFIALIVVFALIGLAKGLFESILSIFSSALSIIIAILASKYVASFLNNLVNCNAFFAEKMVAWGWVPAEGATLFGKVFTPEQLANTCTIILSVVAVWLLIKLAIWLLSKLFDNVTASSNAVSGLNRVLGMIFGAAKGFLIGCVALGLVTVISVFVPNNSIVKEIQDKNAMTNFVYKYVSTWVGDNLEKHIEDIVGKGSEQGGEQPGEGGEQQQVEANAQYVVDGNVCYVLTDTRV